MSNAYFRSELGVLLGDRLGQLVQGREFPRSGQSAADHRRQDFDLEIGDQSGDLIDDLMLPAEGADHRDEFQFRPQGVGEIRRVGDLRMRSDVDRGGPEHDRRGVHKGHGQLADIGLGQVELMDLDAALGQGGDEVIDHQRRAAVHGDVGDDGLVLGLVRDPVAVGFEDKLGIGISFLRAAADCVFFRLFPSSHREKWYIMKRRDVKMARGAPSRGKWRARVPGAPSKGNRRA